MNKYLKTAVAAALKSGAFIKRSVGKIGKVTYKAGDNIVTDCDKRSEAMIVDTILKAFPDHGILAEESGLADARNNRGYRWIIDPIDGTTNFAHGFPFFCVSIGLEIDHEIAVGVVYDPMRDELFRAVKGGGAFLNKKKIIVSGVKKLSESLLSTGFSYGNERKIRNLCNFQNFLISAMAIRRAGSAALDLCYVACGRFDGYWEMELHPWDAAAGMLIVKEAGGVVTRFSGGRYTPYDRDVLATNGLLHEQMKKVISLSPHK